LIEQTTGIPVRIITGDEEAYFDFLAVRHTMGLDDALIIDTGGGSCELILMRGKNLHRKNQSADRICNFIGKFTDKGDMSAAAIFRLFNHIHARLSQIDWLEQARGLPVVTVGGNHRAAGKIWKTTWMMMLPCMATPSRGRISTASTWICWTQTTIGARSCSAKQGPG